MTVLFIFGVVSRFLPHAWNLTPLTAIALFVGSYIGWRYSTALMLVVMLISDIFIGFYNLPVMFAVYGCFIFSGIIGSLLKKRTAFGVLASSVGSSLVFFVVTNGAVWFFETMYEHTFSGLMQSYVMGLPFFRNMLAGDLLYTSILFGAAYAVTLVTTKKLVPQV